MPDTSTALSYKVNGICILVHTSQAILPLIVIIFITDIVASAEDDAFVQYNSFVQYSIF